MATWRKIKSLAPEHHSSEETRISLLDVDHIVRILRRSAMVQIAKQVLKSASTNPVLTNMAVSFTKGTENIRTFFDKQNGVPEFPEIGESCTVSGKDTEGNEVSFTGVVDSVAHGYDIGSNYLSHTIDIHLL